ncbi:unnamed protein product, partial [Porites lobata]
MVFICFFLLFTWLLKDSMKHNYDYELEPILSPRFTSPRFTSPVQSSPVQSFQYSIPRLT